VKLKRVAIWGQREKSEIKTSSSSSSSSSSTGGTSRGVNYTGGIVYIAKDTFYGYFISLFSS